MVEPITIDDIMSELGRLTERTQTPGGFTITELRDATGKHVNDLRNMVRKGLAAGKLAADRQLRPSIDGTTRWVPVYRFVAANDTSAKRVAKKKK
jgi:hypothetical protein